jgi:hypothetical protein
MTITNKLYDECVIPKSKNEWTTYAAIVNSKKD